MEAIFVFGNVSIFIPSDIFTGTFLFTVDFFRNNNKQHIFLEHRGLYLYFVIYNYILLSCSLAIPNLISYLLHPNLKNT